MLFTSFCKFSLSLSFAHTHTFYLLFPTWPFPSFYLFLTLLFSFISQIFHTPFWFKLVDFLFSLSCPLPLFTKKPFLIIDFIYSGLELVTQNSTKIRYRRKMISFKKRRLAFTSTTGADGNIDGIRQPVTGEPSIKFRFLEVWEKLHQVRAKV